MECANQPKNSQRCNCSYPGCPRHGVCCDCIAYHRSHNELPACYFTSAQERTYNRSISFFVKSQSR